MQSELGDLRITLLQKGEEKSVGSDILKTWKLKNTGLKADNCVYHEKSQMQITE